MPIRVPPAAVRPGLGLIRRFVLTADLTPTQQRTRLDAAMKVMVLVPRGTSVVPFSRAGMSGLRITARGANPERAAVHLHGGAYIAGSPSMVRAFAAALSAAADCSVLVPDYPLAPEHPWPEPVDAVLALWESLVVPGGRAPALVGDSAGAGLALALALRLRDGGGVAPAALGLICPFLDLAVVRQAHPKDALLTTAWLAQGAAAYAGGNDPATPEMSPLNADLAGLPPIHVVSASYDTLAPDAHRLTEAVRAAGGRIDHVAQEGLWHDFPLQAGTIAAGDEAARQLGEFLSRAWG